MLLYQPLGDGTEKIYLYRTDESQKKPKQTRMDHVTNHVVEDAKSAQKKRKRPVGRIKMIFIVSCLE